MPKVMVNPDCILSIAAGLTVLAGLAGCEKPATPMDKVTVTIAEHRFHLETALDDSTRYRGLSDRKEIEAYGGMLFVYPRPQTLRFVMRRCLVPIDLIYIDPAGRVIKTHRMKVEPYNCKENDLIRYSSQWPALCAIELRGGTIDWLDIRTGDTIRLPIPLLRSAAR